MDGFKDLSDRDPTSLFNLFGLLPYDVPSFLIIGAWPVAMGSVDVDTAKIKSKTSRSSTTKNLRFLSNLSNSDPCSISSWSSYLLDI